MSPARAEQYCSLVEMALDICSPEHYGHAVPPELVLRASRILKLIPREVAPPMPEPVSSFAEPVHLVDE